MLNLLQKQPDFSVIRQSLEGPHRPLLPPLDAPEWRKARANPNTKKWTAAIFSLVEKEAFEPMPPLTDDLYATFFKTGERLSFENVYFERRRRLGRAGMAVLLTTGKKRSRFIPSLIHKIEETMAEESWTFPAHVPHEPSGKDAMHIDLFAAETANIMGELLTLFSAILPKALITRIKRRLRKQFFDNYINNFTKWFWRDVPMNWNAVCHQGVLGAALAAEDDTRRLARMLALASKGLPRFLDGFGADGTTSEGPGYWSYGFGRFADLNFQLETRSGGKLSLFEGNEKIMRIAAFAPAMIFSNGHLVNFSDGEHKAALPPPLLGYLGTRLEGPDFHAMVIEGYQRLADAGLAFHWERMDLFSLVRIYLGCPVSLETKDEVIRKDVFFPDYGAVVARGKDAAGNLWEFAAKAGFNEEHHNHNDCGSWLLNINGSPVFIEIGAPEYVRAFFSEKRYTFLAARSLGHSVPFVNGREQANGVAFTSKVIACELEPARARFVIDLTQSYPAAAGVRSLIREFIFDKTGGRIAITDSYELEKPRPFESVIITGSPVTWTLSKGKIATAGGTVQLMPGKGAVIFTVESCAYRGHSGTDERVERIRLRPRKETAKGKISFQISLAGAD